MTEAAVSTDRENKLHVVMQNAARAAVELELTGAAFAKLRANLIEAWQASDPRDEKGREKLWLATTQLTQVETALRTLVQNGAVAKKEIDAIRKAGDPKRFFRNNR